MNFTPKQPTLSRAQRRLWDRLNEFIREGGGWIISPPTTGQIRLETVIGSTLPNDLKDAGYNIHHLGTHERLMPVNNANTAVTGQQVGVGVVNVWQFDLPAEKPRGPSGLIDKP
jgi:hypothetical protein